MPDELFTTRSISLLSPSALKLLTDWEFHLAVGEMRALSSAELRNALRQRADLARLIQIYRQQLNGINPALFPYLTVAQKKSLRQKIVRVHYLYSVQACLDELEIKFDKLTEDRACCRKYERLLDDLGTLPTLGELTRPEAQLQRDSHESEKPLTWFGAYIVAPILGVNMLDFCAGKLQFTYNMLRTMDKKPLYLGWSRNLILSIMKAFPGRMQQMPIEQAAFASMAETNSYIGFVVAQTLFSLQIFLVMKNSLAGAWINKKKALQLSNLELFTLQIYPRRFVLLNLLAESVASLVMFLSLFSMVPIWPWESLVGIGFRLVQLSVLAFSFDAERTQVQKNLELIQHEMEQLRARNQESSEEYHHLSQAYVREAADWRFRKIEFRNRFMGVLGLLIGFALFSCLLFPPGLIPTATALVIVLTGAAVCVGVSLLMAYLDTEVMLAKNKSDQHLIQEQLDAALTQFQQCQLDNPEHALPQMKALYLEIKQLASSSQYKQRLYAHQQQVLAVSLLGDMLFPPAAIVSLLLLPTGTSLLVIGGLILLLNFAKWLINRYAPEQAALPVFNEDEFKAFCLKPELATLESDHYKHQGFFIEDKQTHVDEPVDEPVDGAFKPPAPSSS
jgi:hypothetical protein